MVGHVGRAQAVSDGFGYAKGERQFGIRLNLRTMRSKIRAGRTRWSALMLAAVEPAVRRSFGFRSVAAATITLATTAGSSPPLVFFASTSSKVRRPDA